MKSQRPQAAAPQQDTRTLEQALRETAQAKWQGRRCYATNISQAGRAVAAVGLESIERRGVKGRHPEGPNHHYEQDILAGVTVAQIEPADIRNATACWYKHGLSPATINKRLNCLSAMGVSVEGCRVREPKVLKWWLKPEDEKRLVVFLQNDEADEAERRFSLFVQWTTRTGLRIEESLRLRWSDFNGLFTEVTVPGLKTAEAQATLPLGAEASAIVKDLYWPDRRGRQVFCLAYEEARDLWERCREFLGVQDNPTATLKALRRSAARHLHITKGMPLDMVRQYLRHEDIETTLGYLRLTGGYGTEEMRRWL